MTIAARLPDGTKVRFRDPEAFGQWLFTEAPAGVIQVLNGSPSSGPVPGTTSGEDPSMRVEPRCLPPHQPGPGQLIS